MSTMKDVAKRAGVSLGTVSNVLNNRSTVLPENRERVLRAVDELNFKANEVARSLKTKSSRDIALIIPDISNPFYPELARGAEDAANKAGYQVLLCNNDRTYQKEWDYIESLSSKNIAGLIMVKPQLSLQEISEISRQLCVILVDIGMPLQSSYNVINVNDYGGFTQGMQLLYTHGHSKIGFISGLMESLSSHTRYSAYVQFLAQHGIPLREEYVIKGDYTWNSGYQAAKGFMAIGDPPTAIFAANDLMAIGCMKALQEIGLEIPGDISVLGYDNIEMTNLCTPGLTTIEQPKYDLGVCSVEMLLRRVEERNAGKDKQSEHLMMDTCVILRSSVGDVKA